VPRSAAPIRSPGPGRPKDLEKRAAILNAAKRLFPARGLEGTSMDAIAAEAGVSKLTVYSHFSDKDTLFRAAVEARCEELLPSAFFELGGKGEPMRQRLLTIGRAFHRLVTSDESVAMYRMMAAQAPGNVKLAELFFEAGPRRVLDAFEALLVKADRAGALRIDDCRDAAEHFFCLVKGVCHMRMLIGCCPAPTAKQAEAHIAKVVDLFLRAYAPPSRPRSRRPALHA
jgi:TetR/AcrR family transcriptional regulator, mexJK operon transcriptional repressor